MPHLVLVRQLEQRSELEVIELEILDVETGILNVKTHDWKLQVKLPLELAMKICTTYNLYNGFQILEINLEKLLYKKYRSLFDGHHILYVRFPSGIFHLTKNKLGWIPKEAQEEFLNHIRSRFMIEVKKAPVKQEVKQ